MTDVEMMPYAFLKEVKKTMEDSEARRQASERKSMNLFINWTEQVIMVILASLLFLAIILLVSIQHLANDIQASRASSLQGRALVCQLYYDAHKTLPSQCDQIKSQIDILNRQ